MRYAFTAVLLAAGAAAACTRTARVETGGDVAPEVVTANSRTVPVGTALQARLNQTLGTEKNRVGDEFTATVQKALLSQSGAVVVPEGALVHGRVTGLQSSKQVGEPAAIRLDFERLSFDGNDYPFEARITATELKQQGDTKDETLKKAGVGAAAGAVLGAILGEGNLGKILLGGALGAAAGTAISLGTGEVEAVLPAGTVMNLQTTQMVSLR